MENNQENNSQCAKAVESLTESEELMRFIVKHDPNAIAIFDAKLHYIAVSERYLSDYGVKEEAIIGKHHYEVFPDLPQSLREIHQRCLQGAIESSENDAFEKPDGSITYGRWECRPWRRANGQIGGLIIYTEDTTDRKKTEMALLESEIKYRAFFENSMDAILLTSPDGQTYSANQAACTLFGYSEEELIRLGRSAVEDLTDHRLDVLLAERKLYGKARGEVTFLRKDGTRFLAEVSSSIFQNNEGLDRTSMIIRDITERKNIQNELKFQADLLNQVGQAVIATDIQARVTYWNSGAEKIYGYTSAEAMGQNIVSLTPAEATKEQAYELMEKLRQGQTWAGEFLVKGKDGRNFLADVTDSPIFDANGKLTGVIGISSDITERKKAEETLHILSSAVEQTIDSILITDHQGTIQYVNPAFESLTGYSSAEVLGKNPRILKSGFKDQEYYETMWKTILSGNVFFAEVVNKKKNGELFYAKNTIAPIFDKNGIITHFVGTGVDISERKRVKNELIKAKEKAEESDRLKSAFLANMSHEVRTPLNSIIGFSELLADPDFEAGQKNEFIQHIVLNGNQLLTIISDIMDISRMESGEIILRKTQVNVQNVISALVEQFSFQAATKKLKLQLILPDTAQETLLVTDADRLNQVFINLISNALKFTQKGQITIGFQPHGNLIEFYVQDTGIGISEENQEKIFERFRQLEDAQTRSFGGNGLGLAISKKLVELMGGTIRVESEPGKGSTFYFTLPAE